MNYNYNYPQLAREAGFRLRLYKDGPIDWHLLGCFEIERLMRDQNLEDIDKALLHLSEAPLGSALMDSNVLDSGIAKYFVVSQFAIQYLLFCRNFLDETVQELRESHAESQFELARLNKLLNEANNEILQLHKKMTQMEAIHEVIYPCHLCTKNFANNEALNIHIGRKHAGGNANNVGNSDNSRQQQKSSPQSNERVKDLNLINTIKLELEIKQLKERLNSAEREIKARSGATTKHQAQSTPRQVEQRNVAIQSNLADEKELNEAVDLAEAEHANDLAERHSELSKIKNKISAFEEWRVTQFANSEESIAEIKRKLSDIAQALERANSGTVPVKRTLETPTDLSEATVNETHEPRALERRVSVEDLERLLSEKIAEIGKANSDKLTEIVQNIEANYRDKLFELEREVKQVTKQQAITIDKPMPKSLEPSQSSKIPVVVQAAPRLKRSTTTAPVEAELRAVQMVQSVNNEPKEVEDEGTYSIELKPTKSTAATDEKIIEPKAIEPVASVAAEASNETFIKSVEQAAKQQAKITMETSSSDATDVSESLSEDEETSSKEEKVEVDVISKPNSKVKVEPVKKQEPAKLPKTKRPKSPKKYTRKDAKHLMARRLERCGVDMDMKSLSTSSLKRANNELQETRNKAKQKHPNYFVTRNRIKKFVDKLCSRKMTKKAEEMLTNKTPLQPGKLPKQTTKQTSEEQTTEDSNESSSDEDHKVDAGKALIEAQKQTKDDFKKRLELLLASPIKRPLGMEGPTTSKMVQIRETMNETRNLTLAKPMPVPRKRVMFDTPAAGQF